MSRKSKREIEEEVEELENEAESEESEYEPTTLAEMWAEDVSDGDPPKVTAEEWEEMVDEQ